MKGRLNTEVVYYMGQPESEDLQVRKTDFFIVPISSKLKSYFYSEFTELMLQCTEFF